MGTMIEALIVLIILVSYILFHLSRKILYEIMFYFQSKRKYTNPKKGEYFKSLVFEDYYRIIEVKDDYVFYESKLVHQWHGLKCDLNSWKYRQKQFKLLKVKLF